MSIIDDVKSVASIVQKIDNIELYSKILNLQSQVMELIEQNNNLKSEIKSIKGKNSIKDGLVFENNTYWATRSDGERDGPFCSKCWDSEQKLIRMNSRGADGNHQCPDCQIPLYPFGKKTLPVIKRTIVKRFD